MTNTNTNLEITWINASQYETDLSKWNDREVNCYKSCICGNLIINKGDFVLVSNTDSAEPDTESGCDIAEILHMYEVFDTQLEESSCRAIIQWYSRASAVPAKCLDTDDICIDFDYEIIEDIRFVNDISLETIFKKCNVIKSDVSAVVSNIVKREKRHKIPMYVCRYKLVRKGRGYMLVPLKWNNDEKLETRSGKTPSSDRKLRQHYSVVKTPNKISTPKTSISTPKNRVKLADEAPLMLSHEKVSAQLDVTPKKRKNIVSPIKIVRNTVQKLTRNHLTEKEISAVLDEDSKDESDDTDESDIENLTPNKKKAIESKRNANYLPHSPIYEGETPSKIFNLSSLNISAARRNLNDSLNSESNNTAGTDIQNYSIVKDTPDGKLSDDINIKLRLSSKRSIKTPARYIDESKSLRNSSRKRTPDTTITDTHTSPRKTRRNSVKIDTSISVTPSTTSRSDNLRRRSILKTPSSKLVNSENTPKKNITLSNIVEEFSINDVRTKTPRTCSRRKSVGFYYEHFSDDSPATPISSTRSTVSKREIIPTTPKSSRRMKTEVETPTNKLKSIRVGTLTPSIHTRDAPIDRRRSQLEIAREGLHVSAVPKHLPCRENEFKNIYNFIEGKILDQCGGCMYVSGVPGTGKTATVTEVIKTLKHDASIDEIPEFEFIEINGMRLTEPRQAYVQIYKQLTGKTLAWKQAHELLEKRFTTGAPRRVTTVLLVDELDILCNRRQDVIYNLLDWPTKSIARLVVITIANTMDLPERLLMGKVTSRLGLTRLTFQPYSHKQLQEIVLSRLAGTEAFNSDAVQLVARKVAAVSGDARRALDICRRATEIAEITNLNGNNKKEIVTMEHVQNALGEMMESVNVRIIRGCSKYEQLFLQAVAAEVSRTGIEETSFLGVYSQFEIITTFSGMSTPPASCALQLCARLGASRLLICEHSRNDIYQKILLNISADDIHYALQSRVNY